MRTYKEFIKEAESFWSIEDAPAWISEIKKGIKAPVVNVRVSTLGGEDKASILIGLSLDQEKDWTNKIYENSRYARFHLYRTGVLEMFARKYTLDKFRKSRVKSAKDVVTKINTWIKKVG